jgi:phenylalanyl-tRNA synthetase beta chain
MKYSYRWLKELSGTKKSADQIAKLLMTHAFEVEGMEKFSLGLEGVTIGKVVGLEKHPDADRLRVAQVEFSKKDTRQIVCGAPNLALDQKVAVALPGVVLPGNVEIKQATIRGVESNGMICSAAEMGLGDDHSGIMVLPEDAPIGALFAKHFGLEDTIIEAKILPDRGSDALSYQGLAREIAALDGYAPHFGEKKSKAVRVPSYNRAPKVVITDKIGCPRYIGISFKDVIVGESPLWLKTKLILSGLRPINNIVDITNYLMLLTGQPMHAFDADKLSGAVTIRRAKKNEKLVILTGETKKLCEDDLVIADTKKAIALAGVMGGKDTGVTAETKNIFFEIANFESSSIRRTKTRHNLPTDASYRFERNLDPNLPGMVAGEAAMLISTLAGGKLSGVRDVYPRPLKPWKIALSLDRVGHVLGGNLPLFEAVRSLALLGLQVKKVPGKEVLSVTVPTRRPDLCDEWDLIEEIGRMRGYDKIAPAAPCLPLIPAVENPSKQFARRTKEYLANAGFDEIMTYSFYSDKDRAAARLPEAGHLALENPMNPDQALLRMTLLPTLLRKVRENLRHIDTFDCFEWESVFQNGMKRGVIDERKMLALATVLATKDAKGAAFYALKGKVQAFLKTMRVAEVSFIPVSDAPTFAAVSMLHPTRAALIMAGDRIVGVMGELHPSVAKSFNLDARTACAEFDAEVLRSAIDDKIVYEPLRRFPYAVRDISLVFSRGTSVGEVEQMFCEVGAPLLEKHELFDIYEQNGEKSLAFRLFFGALDRTITSTEMDQVFDRIVEEAGKQFGALLKQ